MSTYIAQTDNQNSPSAESLLPEGNKTLWIRIFSAVTICSGLSSGASLFAFTTLTGLIVIAGLSWAGVSLWQAADGFNKASKSGDWTDANDALKKLNAHFKILGLTGIVSFILIVIFAIDLLASSTGKGGSGSPSSPW